MIGEEHYVCELELNKAIEEIYPDWRRFRYPHGPAGTKFKEGGFVSFNGRVGKIIYGYCDFADKKNVPLSKQNKDDLSALDLLQFK